MGIIRQFAETAAPSGDLLSALGIDWKLLGVQIIAFLILVFILGKFVYPLFMKAIDKRQEDIEKAMQLAAEAEETASLRQEETKQLFEEAKKEAASIIDTAKLEASGIVSDSEEKAVKQAEQIVASAHDQLAKDVESARKQLRDDAVELITLATAKVVRATHDKKADQKLVAKAIGDLE